MVPTCLKDPKRRNRLKIFLKLPNGSQAVIAAAAAAAAPTSTDAAMPRRRPTRDHRASLSLVGTSKHTAGRALRRDAPRDAAWEGPVLDDIFREFSPFSGEIYRTVDEGTREFVT